MTPERIAQKIGLDDTDREILTLRLAELRDALVDYDRCGQKNMASITRDDIAWIEARLGLCDPDQPLVPRAEVELKRRHESQRLAMLEHVLQGYDALIRNEMDYAGPRKYQSVMKLCSMADKLRTYDPSSGGVSSYQNMLGDIVGRDMNDLADVGDDGRFRIHVDRNEVIDAGMGILPPPPIGGVAPPIIRPALPHRQTSDIARELSDCVDVVKKVGATVEKSADRIELQRDLRTLFDLRMDLGGMPDTPERVQQFATLDAKINAKIAEALAVGTTTSAERLSDAPDSSQPASPASNPDVVPAELPRGHSPAGNVRDVVRSDPDQAVAPGGGGDRGAVGDRHQERLVPRSPHPVVDYYPIAGADREGGQGAG